MANLALETPLADLANLSPRFLKLFNKIGARTVRDLLWHFPFRYEDFSTTYSIADLEPNQHATVRGVVREVDVRRSWRKRMAIVEATIHDETGSIRAVWFNQPYLKQVLIPGRTMNFAGKVLTHEDGDIYLAHPTFELVRGSREETKHTGRLVPIYPETSGLTSKGIRFVIQPLLKNLKAPEEFLPRDVLEAERLPDIGTALRNIHFPNAIEDAVRAKNRFAFENLFLLHLVNIEQKLKLTEEKAAVIRTDIEKLKAVILKLPFELTFSQKKSLWEIVQDLEKPHPMNRLLQGDVGSGKTVVAALAALTASMNGFQTAFMTPTEVLARQHFETLKKLFRAVPTGNQPTIALLIANTTKMVYESDLETDMKKEELHNNIAIGSVSIVIGTQALIQKAVTFKKLGFVVVDEQHRFGVAQRSALTKQSANRRLTPHFLSMSATPIPRTLMMTIFGDLDISTITELPVGRKPIITKAIEPEHRANAYQFIRQQVKTGRQVFVICPRIDPPKAESESAAQSYRFDFKAFQKLEVKSVKEEYEKLSKKIFPDLRVAMLHGQMKTKEKDRVMRDFSAKGGFPPDGRAGASGGKDHSIDILVSTSVIEVGIDIPNATIMMVEGSERFGLSQLYQFRGRVGRGEYQSYCFLFTDSSGEATKKRIKAILEAKNGFELAERDLALRGPGEFLGESQSGMPDLAMEGLKNVQLIKQSREAAVRLVQNDPTLKNYPALKAKLNQFQKEILRTMN